MALSFDSMNQIGTGPFVNLECSMSGSCSALVQGIELQRIDVGSFCPHPLKATGRSSAPVASSGSSLHHVGVAPVEHFVTAESVAPPGTSLHDRVPLSEVEHVEHGGVAHLEHSVAAESDFSFVSPFEVEESKGAEAWGFCELSARLFRSMCLNSCEALRTGS